MENEESTSSQELYLKAKQIRRDAFELGVEYKIGHIASSLSTVEILVALYYDIMNEDDIFILSKGHGCLAWYAVLRDKGLNPKISGHPDIDIENGIPCTTGSLGHGLPVGVGMALAKKLKSESGRVFVLCGDGEFQEGSMWESLLIASHHQLDNLFIFIDRNRLQSLDETEEILSVEDLYTKLCAFNCPVNEIDGHDIKNIKYMIDTYELSNPRCVIANTVKGKGISYMEGISKWHHRLPNEEELRIAREELK